MKNNAWNGSQQPCTQTMHQMYEYEECFVAWAVNTFWAHSVQINPQQAEMYLHCRSKNNKSELLLFLIRLTVFMVCRNSKEIAVLALLLSPGYVCVWIDLHSVRWSVRQLIGLHELGDIECLLLTSSSDSKRMSSVISPYCNTHDSLKLDVSLDLMGILKTQKYLGETVNVFLSLCLLFSPSGCYINVSVTFLPGSGKMDNSKQLPQMYHLIRLMYGP